MKRFILAAAFLGLAACASSGGAPSPVADSGYKEEMISANRYSVSYTAAKAATPAEIADRTLGRAAQLTLDKGNDWFEIASRINGEQKQTLVIVMGSGETLAGGKTKVYDAKETLAGLKSKKVS
jgi:hypothetical protein